MVYGPPLHLYRRGVSLPGEGQSAKSLDGQIGSAHWLVKIPKSLLKGEGAANPADDSTVKMMSAFLVGVIKG